MNDWHGMVDLFVRVARHGHAFEPGHEAFRERVGERFDRLKHLPVG